MYTHKPITISSLDSITKKTQKSSILYPIFLLPYSITDNTKTSRLLHKLNVYIRFRTFIVIFLDFIVNHPIKSASK